MPLTSVTNQAIQLGFSSIPVVVGLAQEAFSNEALALGASVAGSLGVASVLTGGIVIGSIVLSRIIKPMLEEREIPVSTLDEDALSVGFLSGTIVAAVATPVAGALAAGLIAGTISVLKPNAFHN